MIAPTASIAPTAPTAPTSAPSAAVAPKPDTNRVLGEFRIRMFDRDDHVTFTTRQGMVAGGRIGATFGYHTLREAMFDLAQLTSGAIPAAVVLERDGRFFGHALKGRDLEQGFRAPLRRVHLETDERAEVVDIRTNDRHERVRAFVDGPWSHRFMNR